MYITKRTIKFMWAIIIHENMSPGHNYVDTKIGIILKQIKITVHRGPSNISYKNKVMYLQYIL